MGNMAAEAERSMVMGVLKKQRVYWIDDVRHEA
jgi:hypothetical protein